MFLNENNYSFVNAGSVILIAPLDWGLGHATRCIPIITYFIAIGCKVIIAAEGKQKALLQQEFSTLRFVKIKGYQLRYGKNNFFTILQILFQIPKIFSSIRQEHRWLRVFVDKNKVDAIISDNRYGFYSRRVPSVFITHQLMVQTPFGRMANRWLRSLHYRFINRFSECWVPDYEKNGGLAGALSHPGRFPAIPVRYLGRLSRFHLQDDPVAGSQVLVIISGPEPQRSIFEKMIVHQLAGINRPAVLVRGLPGEKSALPNAGKNLVVYNHLSAAELNGMISRSAILISRPGYSTVMDVIGRKLTCIFIPTPGQSEQEYLARYLSSKHWCLYYPQRRFSLQKALHDAAGFHPEPFSGAPEGAYKTAIETLVSRLARP